MLWTSLVFEHFRSIYEEKMDPKYPSGHCFQKRILSKIFQLKIPIFSQSDGDATQWPNSSKQNLTWGQLRNAHRYQKYVRLVRRFFKESLTCSSQQCLGLAVLLDFYFKGWLLMIWSVYDCSISYLLKFLFFRFSLITYQLVKKSTQSTVISRLMETLQLKTN